MAAIITNNRTQRPRPVVVDFFIVDVVSRLSRPNREKQSNGTPPQMHVVPTNDGRAHKLIVNSLWVVCRY